jgi:hypothetical protein
MHYTQGNKQVLIRISDHPRNYFQLKPHQQEQWPYRFNFAPKSKDTIADLLFFLDMGYKKPK